MAQKKLSIVALVACTGVIGTSHPTHEGKKADFVGLSLKPRDRQELELEIGVEEGTLDDLKVDKNYRATISQGKSTSKFALNFKVDHLAEIDHGKYDERMVVSGDINGHINLNILPSQEEMFFEGKTYNIEFEEVAE